MRLFLIGGFLGSGKTTAIEQACQQLMAHGVKVGVVTNDQGAQLVDSGLMRAAGIPTREVINGCFCCHYDQLEESIQSLQEASQPEVIFAESVGSCTDLVATVVNPWLRFHPQTTVVVSIFADAQRLLQRAWGARLFGQSVTYLYDKQMQEADVLIVNKMDLLTAQELVQVEQFLRENYPHQAVLYQNSLEKTSIQRWLDTLTHFQTEGIRPSLTIDYTTYAAGEAQLGWLDAEVTIHTLEEKAFEAGLALIQHYHDRIQQRMLSIGHLKFLLDNGHSLQKISFTNAIQPHLGSAVEETETHRLRLLINARVETEAELLEQLLWESIATLKEQTGCQVSIGNIAAFQPGYPRPTHRILS